MPFVYSASDEDGKVLYIGRCKSWPERWAGHRRQRADLFDRVRQLYLEHYATMAAAILRERQLIYEHRPPYNRQILVADVAWLRCQECSMVYSSGLGWWKPGDRCNDMSGHGGTFERPCSGVLVDSASA